MAEIDIVLRGIRAYKESDRSILRAVIIVGCPNIDLATDRFMKLQCVLGIRRYGSYQLWLVLRDGYSFSKIASTFFKMYRNYPFCQMTFREWFAEGREDIANNS